MVIAAHMLLETAGSREAAPSPPASPGMVTAYRGTISVSPGMVAGEGFMVLLQALLGVGGEPGGATGIAGVTDVAGANAANTNAMDIADVMTGTADPGEKRDEGGADAGEVAGQGALDQVLAALAGMHQSVLIPAAAVATPATAAGQGAPATAATSAAPATLATPGIPAAAHATAVAPATPATAATPAVPAIPAAPTAQATAAAPATPTAQATAAAPATPAAPATGATPATYSAGFSGATHAHQGVAPSLPANAQPGMAAEAPVLAGVPREPRETAHGADVERTGIETGIEAFTGGIAAVPEGDRAGIGGPNAGTGAGGVAVRMPVDIEELAEKFLAYARVRATADGATVRLSLKPEHLGDLNLDLHWRGNSLEARFLVHNQEALAAVQSQLGRLEEGLRAQGINVGSLEALMWQAGGAGGDQPFSGRWRDRRGKDLGSTGAGVVGVSGVGARNRSPGRLTMAPGLAGGLNFLA